MLKIENNFESICHFENFSNFIGEFENLSIVRFIKQEVDDSIYQPICDRLEKFDTIIYLGIGGSSLGVQAIYHAFDCKKKFIFFDNVDEYNFNKILDNLDLSKCGVLAVSKSGNTPETILALQTLKYFYKKAELDINNYLCILTENNDNILNNYANQYKIPKCEHSSEIGGRFSIFSQVGVLFFKLSKLDLYLFFKGAISVIKSFLEQSAKHDAIIVSNHIIDYKKHPVLFIYNERLKLIGSWFAQLWSESLGKTDSNHVRFGTIPITAIGTTDQHSQLQLYLDGPLDKFFSMIWSDDLKDIKSLNLDLDDKRLTSLNDKNLNDLFRASFKGVYETFTNRGIAAKKIEFDKIDEFNIGAFMFRSILKTIYTAYRLGINAFDQPAVELSKILTKKYLSN